MTIHILVEGPSERVLLEKWSSRLAMGQPVRLHPHQGKGSLPDDVSAVVAKHRRGLLDQLPAKLRGFSSSLDPNDDSVVVLVDADDEDVPSLRARISAAIEQVAPSMRVLVRIAVEETEAFYLGDLRALKAAFPAADMARARAYQPDSICGTWELFGSIVGDGGGNKVAWAEEMAPVLTTKANESRSPSFRDLLLGLRELAAARKAPAKRRAKYRHPSRNRPDTSGKR